MPFINVKTNVPIPAQREESLKTAFGKAIALVPGKSESWLMVGFEPECHLWFKGSSDPAAMVQISVFGSNQKDAYGDLTAAVCDSLSETLGLKKDRIFVSYSETDKWGGNGNNFESKKYSTGSVLYFFVSLCLMAEAFRSERERLAEQSNHC